MSRTITVHIPMRFSIRGGRKAIISQVNLPPARQHVENALLKALAKAHRWRRQIESGAYASITELAKEQRVNESYACRLLRLTLLAPQIVTDVVNGATNKSLKMSQLTKPFPIEWNKQTDL